ncbi:CBO0543 family protein [Metabacillus niabensis]|uniref:CBO0543 family protein n=1 Tax=Metabacillus niabensis TaxID=324854 RepID=UPI00299F4664|nr:CBO0543 family protein [Metabacillus niabensis]
MYTTSLFSTVLQLITDIYLEFKYNFYWYFSPGVDYITLWVVFWIYPSVNILFLNFYPTNKKFSTSVYYILGWTLFALVYEWVAVNYGFFQYNGWKLWYSAIIYPFLYLLLYINWKIIRRLYRLSL